APVLKTGVRKDLGVRIPRPPLTSVARDRRGAHRLSAPDAQRDAYQSHEQKHHDYALREDDGHGQSKRAFAWRRIKQRLLWAIGEVNRLREDVRLHGRNLCRAVE